ncbi:MAG TPA: DUF2007 domain-containing protein [Gemmatimonadales bacterium]|nr:DUF2007 domain-containing protein [Gemmatimonadales bacterium]
MNCPQCGAHLSPEPLALTTVFNTGSIALMAVAKVILNSAGLPFVTKGEGLAELVGGVRFDGAASLITGPMQIQVRAADADEARDLLKEVRETDPAKS